MTDTLHFSTLASSAPFAWVRYFIHDVPNPGSRTFFRRFAGGRSTRLGDHVGSSTVIVSGGVLAFLCFRAPHGRVPERWLILFDQAGYAFTYNSGWT